MGISTTKYPLGVENIFTSMTETNPASESRNPPSKSFVFHYSTSNHGEYFVSGILAGDEVILLNSNSDGIEKITSALQHNACIVGKTYKVRTISGGRSGKLQLGSIILCSDYLEPYKSQLPKWESSLSKKRGLGWGYADRDSGTLGNGGGGDRRFGNKESDAIEGVERAERNWYECNCN
ncbi:DUF4347 domain-containing protein [Microcoleus sp. C2C3]|uniref:DUF4347 domain-containing protein n=1 Tax=unclassified Microcoleus TaxID=2642155 RepID=UPI002FD08889